MQNYIDLELHHESYLVLSEVAVVVAAAVEVHPFGLGTADWTDLVLRMHQMGHAAAVVVAAVEVRLEIADWTDLVLGMHQMGHAAAVVVVVVVDVDAVEVRLEIADWTDLVLEMLQMGHAAAVVVVAVAAVEVRPFGLGTADWADLVLGMHQMGQKNYFDAHLGHWLVQQMHQMMRRDLIHQIHSEEQQKLMGLQAQGLWACRHLKSPIKKVLS